MKEETQTLEELFAVTMYQHFFLCGEEALVLRNQLVHGSSSENTTRMRTRSNLGCSFWKRFSQYFCFIDTAWGGKDLPPLPFPGKHTFQFPE